MILYRDTINMGASNSKDDGLSQAKPQISIPNAQQSVLQGENQGVNKVVNQTSPASESASESVSKAQEPVLTIEDVMSNEVIWLSDVADTAISPILNKHRLRAINEIKQHLQKLKTTNGAEASEKPTKPVEKPAAKPVLEKPVLEKPVLEKPVSEKPTVKPTAKPKPSEKPVSEKPASEKPITLKPKPVKKEPMRVGEHFFNVPPGTMIGIIMAIIPTEKIVVIKIPNITNEHYRKVIANYSDKHVTRYIPMQHVKLNSYVVVKTDLKMNYKDSKDKVAYSFRSANKFIVVPNSLGVFENLTSANCSDAESMCSEVPEIEPVRKAETVKTAKS